MAEAIRDGLRLEAIAADIAGDGDTALELLRVNAYDIAVLDRDIPGPTGDEIAKRIVASGSGMPILMLTAADRLDDKATGFELGADDYLTKPFELRELVLRLRALDRRRAHNRPPVREIAGLRLDPFRREVYRDGRYVALTRKQFAVLEVLVGAEGGVVSAEELLERAWDENADPFTNAVRITVSALRKRLGEPADHRHRGRRRLPHRHATGQPREGGDRGESPGFERSPQAHPQLRGFLMLAGAVLLAAVWVLLCATSPTACIARHASSSWFAADRSTSCAISRRSRPSCWRSCWCSVSSEGGSSPAACSPRCTRITDATRIAATGSLSHRIELEGRNDEFRELADAFDAMLARLEAHVAEQQRFAANASHELRTPLAITQTLLEVARNDPNHDNGELVDRLHAVNTRAIDLTEALLLLSRADQRSFTREHVDLSLVAEEATETLLPLAGEARRHHRDLRRHRAPTIGSHALLLQMTTNLVHNAIVHNLPRTRHACGSRPAFSAERRGAHRREHRREPQPAVGCHARRAVSARHRTRTHRPRRCRPRPGDRREHRPSTRRNPHPHSPRPTAGSASRCNSLSRGRQWSTRSVDQLLRVTPDRRLMAYWQDRDVTGRPFEGLSPGCYYGVRAVGCAEGRGARRRLVAILDCCYAGNRGGATSGSGRAGVTFTPDRSRSCRRATLDASRTRRSSSFVDAGVVQPWWGGRGMLLFDGPIEKVTAFGSPSPLDGSLRRRGPQWWRPADKAWFVATEIDDRWTYLAGSPTLIDTVIDDASI